MALPQAGRALPGGPFESGQFQVCRCPWQAITAVGFWVGVPLSWSTSRCTVWPFKLVIVPSISA